MPDAIGTYIHILTEPDPKKKELYLRANLKNEFTPRKRLNSPEHVYRDFGGTKDSLIMFIRSQQRAGLPPPEWFDELWEIESCSRGRSSVLRGIALRKNAVMELCDPKTVTKRMSWNATCNRICAAAISRGDSLVRFRSKNSSNEKEILDALWENLSRSQQLVICGMKEMVLQTLMVRSHEQKCRVACNLLSGNFPVLDIAEELRFERKRHRKDPTFPNLAMAVGVEYEPVVYSEMMESLNSGSDAVAEKELTSRVSLIRSVHQEFSGILW